MLFKKAKLINLFAYRIILLAHSNFTLRPSFKPKLNVAHIIPKVSIIIITIDLVLGVHYGTFHYEKHIGKYSKTKTFKGCVILMIFVLKKALPVELLTLAQLTIDDL